MEALFICLTTTACIHNLFVECGVLNSLPPFSDNWSSPGIPLSKPHGPGSGHGNISSTSRHSKLMTYLRIDTLSAISRDLAS